MHSWSELIREARSAESPAPGLRAVTLAQWILESGRGTSALARDYANFGGLKWRDEMKGYATPVTYGAHDGFDTYCSFESPSAFISGYWRFVGRSVYSGWEAFANNPGGYIEFLKARGYASDEAYPAKVMSLLSEADALLAEGQEAAGTEPDRPSRAQLQLSQRDFLSAIDPPKFETLGQVRHIYQGARPGGLEGAIVHYDAGRTRPTKGADDPEKGAMQTLDWGATQKFAFATISRTGKIYLPANMDWLAWGYHAGESECPVTHRTSVSRFFVGFEINCPGYVYPTSDPDVFIAWFDAKRDDDGNVILNSKGQATLVSANPEIYRKAELRHVANNTDNIKPGWYVPYTQAQQDALINVLLWLKARHPKTFRLDYVFGHDEVAPKRKLDPGGSYGLPTARAPGQAQTMAQLRSVLLKNWADVQTGA
ncbi:MAG TPA: glucosaminidase domain-containing protein [Bosea sp. (in: a-proteobacteria)]|jgi:hypothetical protein|uniref:glucosaminidase domain-containing protein n=1 Tax=Bosea sp. (in: a-proteobacteria) TaxID=1871050 RepID=UPI002DDDAE0B|nr:glucosaminidase domain-containing protein [Bosea sp. (in: a-proteobacteria)]HEV2556930.1 glucosaminidase domain-containing protein [Bosea sp. (in: a-proteobacteria)]